MIGKERIRKVLTSLRRIASELLRAKGRTRRGAQKQKRRCLKGLVHQEGKSELGDSATSTLHWTECI